MSSRKLYKPSAGGRGKAHKPSAGGSRIVNKSSAGGNRNVHKSSAGGRNLHKSQANSGRDSVSEKDEKFKKTITVLFWIITLIYGGLCLYLYYKQSIQPAVKDTTMVRVFESDLPFHISMVVDDGWYYSLTAIIYLLLYKMAGRTTVLIAVFLALVSVGTVLVTEKLLRVLGVKYKALSCGGAIILNMLMPFYIKWAGAYRYISYQSGNVWHNSTYQCMKLAALLCLWLFLVIDKKAISKGIGIKEWLYFAIALAVCTAIKPSFLTIFAPAFAVKLLINWLKDKVPFKRIFIWGITVLPACGVMLWQNSVLFGAETENGFTISFMKAFSNNSNHPKVTVLLSLAFPMVVFICYAVDRVRSGGFKKIFEDRVYMFSIVMALVGFAEAALLVETGSRSQDGNFLWGYAIALFWLYSVSFVKWSAMLVKRKWLLAGAGGLVLAYQYYCGIRFFSMLMVGITYFMNF